MTHRVGVVVGALALAALAQPTPALAGVGTTAAFGGGVGVTAGPSAPTLDYRRGPVLVQLRLLDQLAPLALSGPFYVNTGLDVTAVALHQPVSPHVEGVIMPGAGVHLDTAAGLAWDFVLEARVGAEVQDKMGLGLYVVPTLGLTDRVTGDLGVAYGGSIQLSVWFAQ